MDVKDIIKKYAKTGWKVLLLQALIVLAYLGMIMIASYLFGDVQAPKVDSFVDYIIFPVILAAIFIAYLTINGFIAQKIFKWR